MNASPTVGIVGIPFDNHSSFEKGPAGAPDIIRETLWKGSMNKVAESGADLRDNPHLIDMGNLELPTGLMEEAYVEAIQAPLTTALARGVRLLSLGGDHSVTYPILEAYAKQYERFSILHIDAHSDLYDSFQGNKYSNACPFARVMEKGLCRRLVQVGIRTLNDHQRDQIKSFRVETHTMENWQGRLSMNFDEPVYLSIDLDGLDPAFAPGVSHREPGGLSTREVIRLIHQINQPVIGADIVEYNPNRDIDGMTAQVAAKLVKEVSAKMLMS